MIAHRRVEKRHGSKMLSPSRCFLRLHHHLLCTSPNPNPTSDKPLRHVIKPVLKERHPDAFVSLFNLSSSDPHLRANSHVYDLAVRRLSAANRPDAVESLIEHQKSFPEFTHSEGFAARLILLYGRAHMLPHALSTFRSLKCPRTALFLNSLLTAYARSDDAGPARIAALIQEVQSSFPDVTPTVVSYNVIVSTLCDKQAFEQAMCVLELMEKKGIAPNLVTYNTLLHGFYSNGRFDDGERIWERMKERDVRSYNSRLRGLVKEKRVSDAVKVFDEMRRVGVKPDAFSFNALIRGCCQDEMLEEAKKVYLGLGKNGCEPDVRTFQTLIRALCEAKEYDFAVRLCNESINMSCFLEVEVLQQVLDGLAKEKMFEKAKKLVKHVRSKVFYASKHFKVPLPCLAL